MDFTLNPDQQAIVDSAHRLVATDIEPLLARYPADRPLPKDAAHALVQAGARMGLAGARIPEDAGGNQLKALDYGLLYEQLPPVAAFILQPHEAAAMRLYLGCNDEQRARYLPDLLAGNLIGITAITEPNVGSDPRGVQTTAKRQGDELVISGRKQWISNATICDLVILTCRMKDDAGKDQLVRVLVDKRESHFEAREIPVVGLQQAPLGELLFDDCRVPIANLCLGNSTSSAQSLTLAWLANRPMMGLGAAHLAQRAFDLAKEYATSRRQFGREIGRFQLIQNDLAEIETSITASRLLCYNALAAIDRRERANGLSAMAKRYSVETCERAIGLAMRIHGAMGLSRELGIERLWRDAKMLSIPDGTPGILTLIQGREITGMDAFRS